MRPGSSFNAGQSNAENGTDARLPPSIRCHGWAIALTGTRFANPNDNLLYPGFDGSLSRKPTVPATTKRAATRSLLALTAADLMKSPVVTIPQDTSLREAARLLHRSGVSGAPVVDPEGHCIGMLSSSDFVTRAGDEGDGISFLAPWGEMIDIEESPDDELRHYMTVQPVTVAGTIPLGELAQKMVDDHIHRVLVAGEHGRPCGIVTSTDVMAAVAQAAR
jgi:CBS domain-containing protein